jgi:hypothetical protein
MKTLRNDRDKAEILDRLHALRSDSRRRWGRMSAHQMVCHLTDSFRMLHGTRPVSEASGPMQRTLVKWIALYAPVRWPAGIATRPEVDQEVGGTKPDEFARDVADLERMVELMVAAGSSLNGRAHPIFGPLSSPAWLRWGYLHMDHHLRQFGA